MAHYNWEYEGARYRYGFILRPANRYHLPSRVEGSIIIGSNGTHPRYPHGTLDLTEPLTEQELQHFTLELVEGGE